MTPVPYRLNKDVIRVYLSFCGEENIGRVGFLDVRSDNPADIVGVSETPVLDIGKPGRFDDHGVLPASLYWEDGRLFMLYSGYQKFKEFPYTSFTGLAVSKDNGESFQRVKEVPLLDRVQDERYIRSSGTLMKTTEGFLRIYYAAGTRWIARDGLNDMPQYEIRSIDLHGTDLSNVFEGVTEVKGKTAISLRTGEVGIATPQIWWCDNAYHMIYSYRLIAKGYRIGYAVSIDGVKWERRDEKIHDNMSLSGWDSEMMCYGKMLCSETQAYLFYCGNHYGRDGIGYAILAD